MSQKILELAAEVANARDVELPQKLVKIKELLQTDDNPKKLKFEIYKYNLLEALALTFKQEFGYITDGWNLAGELVKSFCLCTTDFSSTDKQYQSVFLPEATENILILARKVQEKYDKSKAFSDNFLTLFKSIMIDYAKIIANNTHLALRSLKSQRLFQLLLSDEQNTTIHVMNAYRDLIKVKRNLLSQLDEKSLYLLLDEIIYKMATVELADVGLAIFQLLNVMCSLDPTLIKNIIRRYKGIKMLTHKWQGKNIDKDLNDFINLWEKGYKTRVTDQEIDDKAIIIQKCWRGYQERKKLKKANKAFAKFHRNFRLKREKLNEQKQKKLVHDELKFQLLLDHRRRQRQRKLQMAELVEILPANQLEKYFETQRNRAALTIQATYRGYKERKKFNDVRVKIIKFKAAVCLQRAVRKWLEGIRAKRTRTAFYSRPLGGLDGATREMYFDKIRKHLDSLPSNPRTEKAAQALHDKAQRAFHNYVLNQRNLRDQCQNIKLLLAVTNNDADLILNAPKLEDTIPEDEINAFAHRSKPVQLAAKLAHKKALHKSNCKWYELLNEDSNDSDEEYDIRDEAFDQLNINLSNLNFNANTNNYYVNKSNRKANASSNIGSHDDDVFMLHTTRQGITKRERNQLKTNILRKSMAHMMIHTPEKLSIWNVEPEPASFSNKK